MIFGSGQTPPMNWREFLLGVVFGFVPWVVGIGCIADLLIGTVMRGTR